MGTEAAQEMQAGRGRRLWPTATLLVVIALLLGAMAGFWAGRSGAVPDGPGPVPPVACTDIGAVDGVSLELGREDVGEATTAMLVVRTGSQEVRVPVDLTSDRWAQGTTSIWATLTGPEMQDIDAVELVLADADGAERRITASDPGEPVRVSPNGEACEPHVLQSAFRIEDGSLVRSAG
ncbi:hypothetical protein [Brachybacterium hainanense]|uniref:Uncharacterized protein n=1 Tax=Brachybacterium hainanense TaxID=1541174 RepID=A0ABV6R8C3_9MICO